MFKKVSLLVVLVIMCMIGSSWASTITFTDTTLFDACGTTPAGDLIDYGGSDVDKLEGSGDYVIWAHNFTYSPPLNYLISGVLRLYLRDDADDRRFEGEYGILLGEDGLFIIGEIDTGIYPFNLDINYLSDGVFGVALGSLAGDFFIDRSDLTVEYAPVPEPATILLVSGGLFGLAGIRRRKRIQA